MTSDCSLIRNPIYEELVSLGLIDPSSVVRISASTRDAALSVFQDKRSKVIFLESVQTSNAYYQDLKPESRDGNLSVVTLSDGKVVKTPALDDSARRFEQFKHLIENRHICDFGTGYGEFLKLCLGVSRHVYGVELQSHCLEHIVRELGDQVSVERKIGRFKHNFDVVTMFHVLEHVPYQVAILKEIRSKLNPGGLLIVEVPHANDFLIGEMDVPGFKQFTFWSEHLVLHTKESLHTVLASSGFADVTVRPFQRYGFTNHLLWLKEGKPGGHERLKHLEDSALDQAYRAFLENRFLCDTLIATARADETLE